MISVSRCLVFTGSNDLDGIESAIRDLEAEIDHVEQERQRENGRRDLKAQEGMAHWAELMFYAAAATTILTAVALWAIVRTLHHTRRAADSADSMLVEAKRTTSASARAWIKGEIRLSENENHIDNPDEPYFKIGVHMENIGKSPAFKIHTRVIMDNDLNSATETAQETAKLALKSDSDFAESSGISLFPSQKFIRHWGPTIHDRGTDKFIFAVINYRTIYDEDVHQTVVVCGVGWNGMGGVPQDIDFATYDWAGGFAT